jgi:hypothetical protein
MKTIMKIKLVSAWITATWVGTVVLLSLQPATAQIAPSGSSTTPAGSLQGLPQDERDVFPNSSSILDLLNRIQSINSGGSAPDAASLDDAAAKFRAQQLQRLQGQQQPLSPGTPTQQVNPPASVQ